jgi:collagenase-like PrtC family protease
MSDMANFSIATTFQKKFLEGIDALNKEYKNSRIKEVFGSFPIQVIGSARSCFDLPKVSLKELREHIRFAHSLNLNFNFLLNAPCIGNIEYTYSGRKKIIEFLEILVELEVDFLTISIPYLIELVKER